jgi:hypothetical protein
VRLCRRRRCAPRPAGARQPPLEGLYQAGMPLLQCCLFQFHELLKSHAPRLGAQLEAEGVVPSMCVATCDAMRVCLAGLLAAWLAGWLPGCVCALVGGSLV